MLYIKLDQAGNPVNHPMLGSNLKSVLEVDSLDEATLKKHGYAVFERAKEAENGMTIHSTDYYMDVDGIVRNRATVREFTQEELTDRFIRARRSYLLVASDWTQAADSPLSAEKKAEWAAYRQDLRDLTQTYPNVQKESDVVWPTEPSKA
jgi:hypothetical protein